MFIHLLRALRRQRQSASVVHANRRPARVAAHQTAAHVHRVRPRAIAIAIDPALGREILYRVLRVASRHRGTAVGARDVERGDGTRAPR